MTSEIPQASNPVSLPSYEAYTSLLDAYGQLSPQHQGLTRGDFEAALEDPTVTKVTIPHGEEEVQVPQLSPVERIHWLNAGFYARTFPDEFATGDVLHYVDFPDIAPDAGVQARIRELARKRGILVFDYPTADPEYPDRVNHLLAQSGVRASSSQVLGTQTYFAGQTRLVRKDYPLAPAADLAATYERALADGIYDESQRQNGVSLVRRVDDDQAQRMYRFYEDAYEVLSDHPCNQGLSPDEFLEVMTEKDTVPKIVNTVDGRIVALCLLDNNLSDLSWVNTEFYQRKYPDKMAARQTMWFPGLAADPTSEVVHNTEAMVGLIAELGELASNDILVVFDCGDMNTGFLDKFLERTINATPQADVDIQSIAAQRYVAIQTELKQ